MRLPPVPPGIPANMAAYLRSLSQYVEMATRGPAATDVVRVLSPDKSVWEIRVDDTGEITSTKVKNG